MNDATTDAQLDVVALTLLRARDEAPQVAQWMTDHPPPTGDAERKAWLADLDAERQRIKLAGSVT